MGRAACLYTGMRPFVSRLSSLASLSVFAITACVTDTVPRDDDSESSQMPALQPTMGPAPGSVPQSSRAAQPAPGLESTPTPSPIAAPPAMAGAAGAGAATSGASAGACDLRGPSFSGQWLVSQRTVVAGLGVKQRAAWWFYYELQQDGAELTVSKGLVCGSQVFPVDPLGASVQFEASFPAMVTKNSHDGRRGRVVANGSGCTVSFERAYSVVGATLPYYADPATPLPLLAEQASGTSPGWEDWDEDGEPGVSLHVSGIARGARYTALRSFGDWSGSVTSAGSKFQLAVTDWGQDEAVLGATSDLLKQTAAPDANAAGDFVQFARLTPDQAAGDAESVCATVRELAPTLTPEANR